MQASEIMNHFLALFTIVTLVNCQPKDVRPSEVARVFLDGRKEPGIALKVGTTESCERLIVNSVDFSNTSPVYSLNIELLPSGKLINVVMQSYGDVRYETQPFNPEKYIKVSDFKYDKQTMTVSFDLNGVLFMPLSNSSIALSGHFENLSVKLFSCNALNSKLTALVESNSSNFDVETLNGGASVLSGNGVIEKRMYFQYFTLSNGLRVVFESEANFTNLAPGTYKIGSGLSAPVNVIFQEYKGLSKPYNFYIYYAPDWQDYRIEGTLTITSQTRLNGRSYTQGTIDFTASDNDGKIRYNVKQGNFRLLNL